MAASWPTNDRMPGMLAASSARVRESELSASAPARLPLGCAPGLPLREIGDGVTKAVLGLLQSGPADEARDGHRNALHEFRDLFGFSLSGEREVFLLLREQPHREN